MPHKNFILEKSNHRLDISKNYFIIIVIMDLQEFPKNYVQYTRAGNKNIIWLL